MKFPLPWSHRYFLGLLTDWELEDQARNAPAEMLSLSVQAAQFIDDQMYPSPAYRTGPLFGTWTQTGAGIQVALAALGGYMHWRDYHPEQPYKMCPEYVLGTIDTLRAVYNPSIEWVGQWLVLPTSEIIDDTAEEWLVHQAYQQGLVSPFRALVCSGLSERASETTAYTCSVGGRRTLPVIREDAAER